MKYIWVHSSKCSLGWKEALLGRLTWRVGKGNTQGKGKTGDIPEVQLEYFMIMT